MSKLYGRLPGTLTATAAALLVCGSVALALSQAGSAPDPLASKTYAEGTYRSAITAKAAEISQSELDAAQSTAQQLLSSAEGQYTDEEIENALAEQVAALLAGRMTTTSLSTGSTVQASLGAELCLVSGSASVKTGELINLTTGQTAPAGSVLTRNQLYLAAESGAAGSITSPASARLAGE